MTEGLVIRWEACRAEAEQARRLILEHRLPAVIAEIGDGRYGFTHVGLDVLAAVERALAVCIETRKHLQEVVAGPAQGFAQRRELSDEERRFVHLFSLFAAAVAGAESLAVLADRPVQVQGTFALAEIQALADVPCHDLAPRLLADLMGYLGFHRRLDDRERRVDSAPGLARCLTAYLRLLGASVSELARDAGMRRLREALEDLPVVILDRRFAGFSWRSELAGDGSAGLLEVTVDQVVGNRNYLDACLRTARDVAGFDRASGSNPKTINPVLFALGRPGCGKTVTAHAVARYFLDYCRERGVRARFLPIRRTDWASSYQNASANNLVRIFREEVAGFDGVVAVYWPDIDTAFAARDDPRVRSEERSILGACFGVFDGTLLPQNGQWFMMADANTMHMDEATVSRITQQPFMLNGAQTPEEMLRLLRDVKLGRHLSYLDIDEAGWTAIGERCSDLGLSGRSLDVIARRVISEIERFDYPDEYFRADLAGRRRIIAERSRRLAGAVVEGIIDEYARFEQAAEARTRAARYRNRVEEIVLNLAASEDAAAMVGRPEP